MNKTTEPELECVLEALSVSALSAAIHELVTERERAVFESARSRLGEKETIVAVIGRQGVGKSTLMSALLGRRLLPIDETETTNVICAVRNSGGTKERSVVTFRDGRTDEGPANETFLRRYTDEQENPGNGLGVKSVDIYLETSLLPLNMVLADTPGVGSLTASTAQVTMDFLPSVSLGVFVMGTAPTLLQSESLFLRATWGFSRSFLFVQNAWASTAAELEEGRVDNMRKLQGIASDEGYTEPVELFLVDAHEGLEGSSANDAARVAESGLAKLTEAIAKRASSGALSARVFSNVPALMTVISSASESAKARIRNLDEAARLDQIEFERRQHEGYEELERLGQRWRTSMSEFEKGLGEASAVFRDDLEARVEEAEERLLTLAEDRKMAADKLAAAVSEQLAFAVKVPANEFQKSYSRLLSDFVEEASLLQRLTMDVSGKVPKLQDVASDVAGNELWSKVGGTVQGLGSIGVGAFVGSAAYAVGAALIAGQTMSAAIAAGAAAIPGVGLAIAGAALLGGFVLKKWQEGKAMGRLIPAIKDAARKARKGATQEVSGAINKHASSVRQHLDLLMSRSIEQQRSVLRQFGEDRTQTAEQRMRTRQELEAHRQALGNAAEPLRLLMQRAAGAER